MDELIKELERFGFGEITGTFTLLHFALVLGLSFVLSLVLAWVYRYTHRGVSYSQSYVHTIVILGTTVALIMLIIGSNIARAFSLVGALSIIRFRSAIKETRDVGFIFMVLAIGTAVGTRFYGPAIFATVLLSAFVVLLYKFNLFAKEVRERILRVQLPVGRDHEKAFDVPFGKYLDQYSVISVETVKVGELEEVVYSVILKKRAKPAELLESIRAHNDNHKVTLVLGQQEIDI